MLEVSNLDAFYGDSHVLFNVDVSIEVGERVALLGRNGAGKSTFLKSVMNAEPHLRGAIRWQGRDLKGLAPHDLARLGFAFVPEDRRIVGNMSVLENLHLAHTGTPRDRRSHSPSEVVDQFPMLQPLRDRAGGVLSGGQQQLLALARAAITNPQLLLLDEPTEGLAPIIVEELARDVQRVCRENGCALILCEQNLWFSRACTESVYVIDSGHIVFAGSWAEFDANPDVKQKHLGVS